MQPKMFHETVLKKTIFVSVSLKRSSLDRVNEIVCLFFQRLNQADYFSVLLSGKLDRFSQMLDQNGSREALLKGKALYN